MNQYDAGASDLADMFMSKPDFTPYTALPPDLRIFDPQMAYDPLDEEFDWEALGDSPVIDDPEDIIVKIYIDDELRNTASYNPSTGYHELKWTGPRLGVFTLKATAEDTIGNIASTEMDVWYFCFVPE